MKPLLSSPKNRVLVWRKWVASEKMEAFGALAGEVAGKCPILTSAPFGKCGRVDIYPADKREALQIKKLLGGRILNLSPDVWWKPQVPRRHPFRIGKRLLVVQDAKQKENLAQREKGKSILIVPAGLAFGTGEHATTRLCLEAISSAPVFPFGAFLDAGTGSGILAMAAKLMGCSNIEAFDYDAKAVAVARENASINGVRVRFQKKDLSRITPGKFKADVVVANIIASVLEKEASRLLSFLNPGGHLVISGIRPCEVTAMKRAFSGASLISKKTSENWCCLVFGKRSIDSDILKSLGNKEME